MAMTCVVYTCTVVAFDLFQKYYTNQGDVPELHYDSMLGRSRDCCVTIM